MLLAGAACWALAGAAFALTIGPSADWATHWLAPALLTGVAIGLTLPVQSAAVVASLPAARFGLGSAVNASFRQLGAVLGVSLFVALVGDTRTATVADYHRAWVPSTPSAWSCCYPGAPRLATRHRSHLGTHRTGAEARAAKQSKINALSQGSLTALDAVELARDQLGLTRFLDTPSARSLALADGVLLAGLST